MSCSLEQRRKWITPEHPRLSRAAAVPPAGPGAASYYYRAEPESADNLHYMRLLDEEYTDIPFTGCGG